jgi:DNA-binding transcriptional ArsR family regulator
VYSEVTIFDKRPLDVSYRARLIFNRMVDHSRAVELDRVFAALADPTRRAILRRLTGSPATINEIAKPFRVSLNAISKHLMVLERAGLLRREIEGRKHHCSAELRPLREADEWLEHYRQFWERRMDSLEAYVARKYGSTRHGKDPRR